MKAKIIAIANQKGGVAKTTSTAAIGSLLTERGYRVLLVDLDTQANLTASLTASAPEETIYGAMRGKYGLPKIEIRKGLSLVPSSSDLGTIESDLAGVAEKEYILRDLLLTAAPDYSFILLDCPPSLGIVTINAFTAASSVLIPMSAEALPATGLAKVEAIIDDVRERYNSSLSLGGIFLTRYERSKLSGRIEQLLRQRYGAKVFRTRIRKNIAIAEAPLVRKDVTTYAPDSNGAKDYRALVEELLSKRL